MRRTDFLIFVSRQVSKNELNPDGTAAISDGEIIEYYNNAQDRLQSLITQLKATAKVFTVQKEIDVVGQQEEYSLADRVFMNKEYHQVEFSATGAVGDYVLLQKVNFFNRDSNSSDYPRGYYRRSGKFYPVPVPSNTAGKFRIMYDRSLDDVDKIRGTISVVTGLTSTGFTSLTVGADADESSTPVNLTNVDYVCISALDGTVKVYNVPVLSYVTGTNVLTPAPGFTFQTGETFAAGDFITFGKYSTIISKLPDECERYLIHYAAEALLHKDSSDDVVKQSEKLQMIEQDILKSMGSQTAEVQNIPQINPDEWW